MDDTRRTEETGTTLVGAPLTKTTAILDAGLQQLGEEFTVGGWTDEARRHVEAALTVIRENTTPADTTGTPG